MVNERENLIAYDMMVELQIILFDKYSLLFVYKKQKVLRIKRRKNENNNEKNTVININGNHMYK